MMSTEYFKAIIDCIGDPIFVKDRHYKYVFMNDAACEMFGKPRKQVLGKTDYDLFPGEHADVFRKTDDSVFETGEENVDEEQITDAQGNVRRIVTKKTLYIDKAGEKHIVGAIRDITERTRAEEALRAGRLQLSEAMDLAHIVYWEFDPATHTFAFNDPFYAFYGTTAEQEGGYRMTRGDYAQRFMHPDDLPLYYQFVEQSTLKPAEYFDLEHRIVRRDEKLTYPGASKGR